MPNCQAAKLSNGSHCARSLLLTTAPNAGKGKVQFRFLFLLIPAPYFWRWSCTD